MYLHKEDKSLETLLARVKGEPINYRDETLTPMYSEPVPEPNREYIMGFYSFLKSEEHSVGNIALHIGNIYRVSIFLRHRDFRELERQDIANLIDHIRGLKLKKLGKKGVSEPLSHRTVEGYKTTIKKMWKYLYPQEDPYNYPPQVSWIRRKKEKNGLLPEECWTPKEIMNLVKSTPSLRDRAFILGLFGSGCRIGEFLPLKRKHCIFDRYSCQITVDGKTGSRRVRLTPAASMALAAWLDIHPDSNPEAYVWVHSQFPEPRMRHLGYPWAHKTLNELRTKAGINKSIRPHLMRHSLATFYAPKLTEAVMNEHFGWRQGGRTAAIYTHLSGKQVDDQILSVFGKKKAVDETEKMMEALNSGEFPITKQIADSIRTEKEGIMMSMITEMQKEIELLKAGSEVSSQFHLEKTNSGDWLKSNAGSVFIENNKLV